MSPTVIPYVAVKSVSTAVAFYTEKLGFALNDKSHYPDQYAHVYLGGPAPHASTAQIMFHPFPSVDNAAAGWTKDDKYMPIDILIALREDGKGKEVVDEWHTKLVAKGAVAKDLPEDKPWNCRQTTFIDPDGNRVSFYYDLNI